MQEEEGKGKLVVLGGGESGVGAAILGKKKNYEVLLSDNGSLKQKYKDVLLNNEIEFEEKGHSLNRIFEATVVVKSPGIPDKAPLIQELKGKGIPVISEIEWASRFTNAKLIGITGSNGKTTTTSLIYHMLKKAGKKAGLAGNIGFSFAKQVAEEVAENDVDVYVLELSSFQLDDIDTLKMDIAVLLNVTADHLDRYDYKLQNYVDSKFRILNQADEKSVLVYCMDDATVVDNLAKANYPGKSKAYGLINAADEVAATVEDGKLQSEQGFTMSTQNVLLKGKHNLLNALAAVLVGEELKLSSEEIKEALSSFQAIEHRLEKVKDVAGVEYINDSKATNVDATYYALDAMAKPVIWIVGGVDKGNDYSVLNDLVASKVKGIVCLGTDNKKLLQAFTGMVSQIQEVGSAKEAVDAATKLASEGDVVLLSPACASFDLFKNYEDRGIQYKQAVHKQ
ncbi:MAG: UDP-N-acetylmuramoylalanine--D-glutamate ligase [Glaciecola sp.]|jgi:UDP-N-acetylmuramoylalanine--D-glutamate ligase